jgi:DNA-binding transcriptional LysR family regulator
VIELRHLRYFVAVAEELHYGRAAKRLHMAQSPLSHQIRQLEREVGTALIDRPHNVVGLTDAGKALLADARRVLADLDEAVNRAQRAARGEVGNLHVGYVSEVTADLLPLGLKAFNEQVPEVELRLTEGTTGTLLDGLRNDLLDVVFARSPSHLGGIIYEQLMEESLMIASPTGSETGDGELTLRDMAESEWILPSREAARGLRNDIECAFHAADYSPMIVREAPTLTAVLLLVAGGIGHALIPASVARLYSVPGVHHARLAAPVPYTTVGMAWRRTDKSCVLGNFLESIRRSAGRQAGPSPGPRAAR